MNWFPLLLSISNRLCDLVHDGEVAPLALQTLARAIVLLSV